MYINISNPIGPLHSTIIFEHCLIFENAAFFKLPKLLYASKSIANIHTSLYSGLVLFYKLCFSWILTFTASPHRSIYSFCSNINCIKQLYIA